jgi:hypothetical protein
MRALRHDQLHDRLIDAYAQVGSANRRSLEALAVILAQFRARGIACILLKGADILPRLHGVWGLRPMVDADLLVHEQDLPAIDRIVRDLGYLPQIDGNPVYRNPDGALALDLVTEIWYTDDQEGIWQRAAPRNPGNLGHLGDLPVLGMGADDLLIYLTAYTVLHRGHFSPTFPQDLALLTRKEALNWDFILEEAGRRHLKIPLFHGLSYAIGHGAVAIPPEALARLAPAGAGEKLLAFLLRRLVREKPIADVGHFLLLITRPRGQKWRWLRQAFCPSPEFLQYRYGSRGHTRPLRTRITRAFHLIAHALNLSAKILSRVCARN